MYDPAALDSQKLRGLLDEEGDRINARIAMAIAGPNVATRGYSNTTGSYSDESKVYLI